MELCQDWYAEQYDASDQINPIGPESGPYVTARGGRRVDDAYELRYTARVLTSIDLANPYIGFRVVKPIKEEQL